MAIDLEYKSLPPVTTDDLIRASKAIHDEVKSYAEDRLAQAESDLGMRLVKMLGKKFDALIEGEFEKKLHREFAKRLDGFEAAMRAAVDRQVKALEDRLLGTLHGALADLGGRHSKSLADFDDRAVRSEQFLAEAFHSGLKQIEAFVASLRLPAPQVHVTVPESRPPDVHFRPNVDVKVPELKPEITVHVPELKVPEVRVEVPPPRALEKTIEYDQYNRPSRITEKQLGEQKALDDLAGGA